MAPLQVFLGGLVLILKALQNLLLNYQEMQHGTIRSLGTLCIHYAVHKDIIFRIGNVFPIITSSFCHRFRTFNRHTRMRSSAEATELAHWATGEETPPHLLVLGTS